MEGNNKAARPRTPSAQTTERQRQGGRRTLNKKQGTPSLEKAKRKPDRKQERCGAPEHVQEAGPPDPAGTPGRAGTHTNTPEAGLLGRARSHTPTCIRTDLAMDTTHTTQRARRARDAHASPPGARRSHSHKERQEATPHHAMHKAGSQMNERQEAKDTAQSTHQACTPVNKHQEATHTAKTTHRASAPVTERQGNTDTAHTTHQAHRAVNKHQEATQTADTTHRACTPVNRR